jgi:hypothetical protein
MEITNIEQAIALYENGLLTAKGLIWFYLQDQQIAPHELNPRRASADLGISITTLYVRIKEIIQTDHHCHTEIHYKDDASPYHSPFV